MSYLVLARKYRPQTFETVIQQEHVTQTLTNAISMERMPHAVLFSGPRGTGKTSVARILAKAMNCEKGPVKTPCNKCRSCREITRGSAVDVFEIDGASNNGVDQIRELRENIKYMPAHSRYKIYIIDEVHMLSIGAFNALLKTLEEPPSHIMFIFATTEPHKIPLTILSRCQRHDFKRIGIESISAHLKLLCRQEGFDVDDEGLIIIAREAGGSMRDALSLLDQVMACSEGDMSHEQLIDILGIIDRKQLFGISNAVFQANIPALLEILDQIYNRGHDVKKLYSDLIEHFRNMMVVKMGSRGEKLVDLPQNEIDRLKDQVAEIPLTYLNQILDFLFSTESSIRYSDQPKLSLELAFIRLLQIKPALPIEVLIEKLDYMKHIFQDGIRHRLDDNVSNYGSSEKPKRFEQAEKIAKFSGAESGESVGDTTPTPRINPGIDEEGLKTTGKRLFDLVAKNHPAIAANLVQSHLKALSDQDIEIEVSGSEFNINMIKRKKNLMVLQQVCNEFFGKRMNLIIHAKKNQHDLPGQKKAADHLRQEALSHPLVSDAIEIFNGNVIDVKLL